MKKAIIAIVAIIILIAGYFLVMKFLLGNDAAPVEEQNPTASVTPTPSATPANSEKTVLGNSVQNRPINAYHYGTGSKEVVFIGGMHAGYSWNTSLVAFELMDYLKANPSVIPAGVKVTVIPVVNPDGLNKVTGKSERFTAADVSNDDAVVVSGRFNANNVDLNRNFDCDWKSSGVWQSRTVSGGTKAFSEPETQAIKTYVESKKPSAVVTWYSAAGGVFASNCHTGILPETKELVSTYAKASGYPAREVFDYYAVTGDMVNWLAKNNIPAISVLLTNHGDTEWTKNKAGIEAILKLQAE
ncbi:MAG: M14 family metallopeptidase [bacterium]|nr:M14 family metallopeptidase [bacterium]